MISDSFLSYLRDKGDPYATCCLLKEEVLLKTRLSSIVSQPIKVVDVIVVVVTVSLDIVVVDVVVIIVVWSKLGQQYLEYCCSHFCCYSYCCCCCC